MHIPSDVLGLLVIFGFIVLVACLLYGGTSRTFRCKKCGFTTSDHLRAHGHVSVENKHTADEI